MEARAYGDPLRESGTIQQAGERRSVRIESLRLVGAMGVVLAHTYGTSIGYGQPDGVLQKTLFGAGSTAFLLLAMSGFLLFGPFLRADFAKDDRVDLRKYAVNRFVRIAPLYYFALIVVLLLSFRPGTWEQWWHFLLLAQNFDKDTAGTVIGPSWTIVVEVHFYLLLPLVALGLAKLSRGSYGRAAIGLLALTAVSLVAHHELARESVLWRYSLPVTGWAFTVGMLLALWRQQWMESPPRWARGPLAHADLWLALSLPFWFWQTQTLRQPEVLGTAVALTIVATTFPLRQGLAARVLGWRPLAFLGLASYGIYLWHVPILEWLRDERFTSNGFAELGIVVVPLVLVWSWITFRLVEEPFLRMRKRWARSAPAQSDDRHSGPVAGQEQPAPAGAG